MYPKEFEDVVTLFEKLPGVGNKTAQRYAFCLMEKSGEVENVIDVISKIKKIKKCKTCGFLSNNEECVFCKAKERDRSKIMVVAYPQEVVAIEKTNSYNGLYHVLNGLISSSKGVFPEDIGVAGLISRINETVKEVIIATSPTLDGEMTSLYLDKILKSKDVLVTRLAHGLPMGSSLDYADDLTLIKALDNRREIDKNK